MNIKLNDKLFIFLLGFFADMSVCLFLNNTFFLYLMYGIVFAYMVFEKKIILKKTLFLAYISLVMCSTILCVMNSIFTIDWKIKSVISCLNMIVCFLCYNIIENKEVYVDVYFKGIYTGCIAQLAWCYLQLLFYKQFSLDLNRVVFGVSSQYKHGEMVYSGLTVHAGILVPILILGFLASKNMILKSLFALMAFVTGNSTAMVAMITCLAGCFLMYIVFDFRQVLKRLKLIKLFAIVVSVILILLLWIKFDLSTTVSFVYNRIISIVIKQTSTSGSDATHLRYITSFPYIIKNSNMINVLFGYGVGTSGFQMSHFFDQYTGQIWTIECDFVDIFYSVGLFGTSIFYFVLFYIMLKGIKIDRRYAIFSMTIIVSGIFYNFQMAWLIIVEFIMLFSVKNNKNCWDKFVLKF